MNLFASIIFIIIIFSNSVKIISYLVIHSSIDFDVLFRLLITKELSRTHFLIKLVLITLSLSL
jgi:hypothetical protein